MKEAGVRGDIKAVGLHNWKNEWRCLNCDGCDVRKSRGGISGSV